MNNGNKLKIIVLTQQLLVTAALNREIYQNVELGEPFHLLHPLNSKTAVILERLWNFIHKFLCFLF